MLFSLVYTWIKYKMLPPSVVSLNRLIVERDSKHRRITSNLGLTFRNSKWSHYARTNINENSRYDFIRSLSWVFYAIVSLLIVTSSSHLLNSTPLHSPFTTIYWFAMDSNLYMQIALSSGFIHFVQTLASSVYCRYSTFVLSQPSNPSSSFNTPTHANVPKRLHKPALYALLKGAPSDTLLVSLFESNSKPKTPFEDLEFLKLFYRTVFLIKLNLHPTPFKTLITSLESNSSKSVVKNPLVLYNIAKLRSPALTTLAIDYALFGSTSGTHSSYSAQWTLTALINNSNFRTQSNGIRGLFYSTQLTQDRLNVLLTLYPELSTLRSSVEDQMHVIRWNRWLYNYSLLHRSSVKTNFYLNAFKSALSTNPYTSSNSSKNLWLPSSFTSSMGESSFGRFKVLQQSLYGTLLNDALNPTPHMSTNFYNKPTLKGLSFYEPSFNWALGRFYYLNSTSTNTIVTKPLPANFLTSAAISSQNYLKTHVALASELSNSLRSFVGQSTLSFTPNDTQSSPTTIFNGTFTADSYLSYNTNSFFSKERIDILQNISKNSSHLKARQNNQELLDPRTFPNPTRTPKL